MFSELDPERRAHLVRRIAELPQAFVTTTTLEDLDPALRPVATPWAVERGAPAVAPARLRPRREPVGDPPTRAGADASRIGDLLPEAARQLGLEEELRLARAMTTWDALVAERVPAAAGLPPRRARRPVALIVEADAPIVAPGAAAARAGAARRALPAAPGGLRSSRGAPGPGPSGRVGRSTPRV